MGAEEGANYNMRTIFPFLSAAFILGTFLGLFLALAFLSKEHELLTPPCCDKDEEGDYSDTKMVVFVRTGRYIFFHTIAS